MNILSINEINNWDDRYFKLAQEVSNWSKDTSTKIGSIAIGKFGQVLSQGFNGFPRGIIDSNERLLNKDIKYRYMVHSEINTIYNASLSGVSLFESDLYVYGLPVCSQCANGIIQSGIKSVKAFLTKDISDTWLESCIEANNKFKEVGIDYKIYRS